VELTLGLARQVLAAQPFSVLVGARVTAFGDGGATLEIDIRDELRQQNGFLHGGVLAYAADNAVTFAGRCDLSTVDDSGDSTAVAAAQGTVVVTGGE